ncbi:MAG: MoxR family ATPase [Myxococcales bacterium]|nr:MoxR family ATPase [Myxococcota bacterium]MDW8281975.1 MoxR family ATPase [Myxococcales bacterium]
MTAEPVKRSSTLPPDSLAHAQRLGQAVLMEVRRAFLGSPELAEALLVCLLSRGHVLLEGVPGVAKTTLVKAFAAALGCEHRRIQFTPDLLPADITGTYVLDPTRQSFVLREGPIFSQIVLGDEINRAPPKTQAALLEAMQEGQVTLDGQTRSLGQPFMVLATQNPLEHEGTYPLPEAQLDRFLMKLLVGYPDAGAEKEMLRTYSFKRPELRPVLSPPAILELQRLAEAVHVDDEIYDYVLGLVHFTRSHRRVALGASPRAALSLLHAARSHALLSGRDYVLPDDVKALARPVLAHRLLLLPDAELEGTRPETVIEEALSKVPVRRGGR